jgi:hypothetical protein
MSHSGDLIRMAEARLPPAEVVAFPGVLTAVDGQNHRKAGAKVYVEVFTVPSTAVDPNTRLPELPTAPLHR